MAPYALFGAVALGMLSQIPGSPRQRARTLVAVLPVAWLLIVLGTVLSVSDWAAAAGMFVLGFAVSFVGVGGPRLVGLAAGMQLLYILPCFPPYDPARWADRLAGVTMAVLLLAGASWCSGRIRAGSRTGRRLADAVGALAGCLAAVAAAWPATRTAGSGWPRCCPKPPTRRRRSGVRCRPATARRRRAGAIGRSRRPAPPG